MKLKVTTKNKNVTPAAVIEVFHVGKMSYQVLVNGVERYAAENFNKAFVVAHTLSVLPENLFKEAMA